MPLWSSVKLVQKSHQGNLAFEMIGGNLGCFPLCQQFRKFGSELSGKVRFSFFQPEYLEFPGGGPEIPVRIMFRQKFPVPF